MANISNKNMDWKQDSEVIAFYKSVIEVTKLDLVNPEESAFEDLKSYLDFLINYVKTLSEKPDNYDNIFNEYKNIIKKYAQMEYDETLENLIKNIKLYLNSIDVEYKDENDYENQEAYSKALVKLFLSKTKKNLFLNSNNCPVLKEILNCLNKYELISYFKYNIAMDKIETYEEEVKNKIKAIKKLHNSIIYLVDERELAYIDLPKSESEIDAYFVKFSDILKENFDAIKINGKSFENLINNINDLGNIDASLKEKANKLLDDIKSMEIKFAFEDFQNKLTPVFIKPETNFPKLQGVSIDYIISYLKGVDEELSRCVNEGILTKDEADNLWTKIDGLYSLLDVSNNNLEDTQQHLSKQEIKAIFEETLNELATLNVDVVFLEENVKYFKNVGHVLKDNRIKCIANSLNKIINEISLVEKTENIDLTEVSLIEIVNDNNEKYDLSRIEYEIYCLEENIDKYYNNNKNIFGKIYDFVNEKVINRQKPNVDAEIINVLESILDGTMLISDIDSVNKMIINTANNTKNKEIKIGLVKLKGLLFDLKNSLKETNLASNINLNKIMALSDFEMFKPAVNIIVDAMNIADDLYKKYFANKVDKKAKKEGSEIYKFYKICKKYGDLEADKITGKQIIKWNKLNRKRKDALDNIQEPSKDTEVDIKYAQQVVNIINNNLDDLIKYNKNGEIIEESYLEYLKQRELEKTELESAKSNLSSALKNAKAYSNMLEKNAPTRLKDYKKYNNQIKAKKYGLRGALGALAVVTLLLTGKGIFKNNDKIVDIDNEPHQEQDKESNNYVNNENSIDNVIDQNENKEDSNKDNKLDEAIKNAITTINKAKNTIEKMPLNSVNEVANLQIGIANLQKNIDQKDLVAILDTTNILLDEIENAQDLINNQTSKEDYVPFGTSIDIVEDAEMYSNMDKLVNKINPKPSHYGTNPDILRTQEGIVFTNGIDVKLAHNDEEAQELVNEGYDVAGYRIANMYSYKDGKIVYEGFVQADDAYGLALNK